MARILLPMLARAARAESDNEFVEALLQAWARGAEADYHSLVRRSESTGRVEFWHPGEGRLEPEHPLMKSFAKLWAMEQPMATHPSVAAFLENGPGVYLRSEWEPDSVWSGVRIIVSWTNRRASGTWFPFSSRPRTARW